MVSRRQLLLAGGAAIALGAVARFWAFDADAAGTDQTFPVTHTDAEWKKILTPEQFKVLREHGTERAGSSPLDHEKRAGVFQCAGCKTPVYSSKTKFDSGTGWPSFWAPIDGAVGTSEDKSFFMVRTEVHCATCGGHLGHVFDDGPPPTGKRYCMNGVAMLFVPAAA